MKRKEPLTEEMFYNAWLEKHYNITVKELVEQEPELIKSPDWYKKYAVSQADHDDWYLWAIDTVAKYYRCSKKEAKRKFMWDYLNLSPSIKKIDAE
jgi:hypothetical protein